MRPWEILLARLRRARAWPLPNERGIRERLLLYAALRDSDEPYIRELMKWPNDRPLIIDPLAPNIAQAFGSLLFGRAPRSRAANEQDNERLADVVESWRAELPSAEETCCSEGEVWWRLRTVPDLPHPQLSWHSRLDVVPLLAGRTPRAVAFVDLLDPIGADRRVAWRHVEIHGRGTVHNFLFRGRSNALGVLMDLTRHPETEDLPELWETGVDALLCGRIVNRWGRRPNVGVSIYNGLWSWFLALNEAASIGRENMRLTAKKRMVVPAGALRQRTADDVDGALRSGSIGMSVRSGGGAVWDAGEDVLVHDPLDDDEGGAPPYRVLEYSFDADKLVLYYQFMVETVCMRSDVVPQFIGSGDFGSGNSGTALRVRLLPTVNAAEAKGSPWDAGDAGLPHIAGLAQLLEVQPLAYGGLGNEEWVEPGGQPVIERETTLPEDPNEVAQRHATLKNAELISIYTSVAERHPDWDNDQIAEEVERIRADARSSLPQTTFDFGGGGGGRDDLDDDADEIPPEPPADEG